MYLVERFLSSYRLVPECQIHPEDQIRTCVIGLTACRILDGCGPDFLSVYMASTQLKMIVGRACCRYFSEDFLIVAEKLGAKLKGISIGTMRSRVDGMVESEIDSTLHRGCLAHPGGPEAKARGQS